MEPKNNRLILSVPNQYRRFWLSQLKSRGSCLKYKRTYRIDIIGDLLHEHLAGIPLLPQRLRDLEREKNRLVIKHIHEGLDHDQRQRKKNDRFNAQAVKDRHALPKSSFFSPDQPVSNGDPQKSEKRFDMGLGRFHF
jgi:hypothetical protein